MKKKFKRQFEFRAHHWKGELQSGARGPEFPEGGDPPDRTRIALTLGLVSLAIAPLGVVAWVLANACLRDIAQGRIDPAGEAYARAARVLGILATCLLVLKVIAFIMVMMGFQLWPYLLSPF